MTDPRPVGSAQRPETDESPRILLIINDVALVSSLIQNLRREGFRVDSARDGASGLRMAREDEPDLVVLDVTLPAIGGLEICRQLRRSSSVPILILSARATEMDKVVGLEVGADDYLTRPFGMRELLARLRALLRRARVAVKDDDKHGEIVTGDIRIVAEDRSVHRPDRVIALRPREFDLLWFLAEHPDQAFTRGELLRRVWGFHHPGAGLRTVDVHVYRLRRKIERDPARPRQLLGVPRVGYRLRTSSSSDNLPATER